MHVAHTLSSRGTIAEKHGSSLGKSSSALAGGFSANILLKAPVKAVDRFTSHLGHPLGHLGVHLGGHHGAVDASVMTGSAPPTPEFASAMQAMESKLSAIDERVDDLCRSHAATHALLERLAEHAGISNPGPAPAQPATQPVRLDPLEQP